MPENNEEIASPYAEEIKEADVIEKDEEAEMNKKIASVAGAFFRALGSLTDDEIYELAYTEAGQNSPRLLEIVNGAYTNMIASGGELPRGHFDHYKKLLSDFNNTIVFNIETKLESNRDVLLAKIIGKAESVDRISHKDIIDALEK